MTKQNTAVIQQSDNDLIFVKIAIFDTKFHFFVPNIPILSLNCQFLNKVRGLKKNFRGVSSGERGLKKNFRGVSSGERGQKKNFSGVSSGEIGLKTFLFRQNNDKNWVKKWICKHFFLVLEHIGIVFGLYYDTI
jgi:hypothetical protein